MPIKSTQHLDFKDRANIGNLDKYIRSDYFWHPFAPGSFTGDAHFNQAQPAVDMSFVLFLDSQNKAILYTFFRPELWINGYFTTKLAYGFTGSTGRKNFDVEVLGHGAGTHNFSAGVSLSSYTITHNPPTANVTYINENEETTNAITPAYDLITVRIDHDGTDEEDTSTANLRFFGGGIRYHPINPQ